MKKTILTLAFLVSALCGFSQTFSYELKDWKLSGSLDRKTDSTYTGVRITVGIVGEPYGFVNTTSSETNATFSFPNTGMDSNEIVAYLNGKAVAWVKEKYPNVK